MQHTLKLLTSAKEDAQSHLLPNPVREAVVEVSALYFIDHELVSSVRTSLVLQSSGECLGFLDQFVASYPQPCCIYLSCSSENERSSIHSKS